MPAATNAPIATQLRSYAPLASHTIGALCEAGWGGGPRVRSAQRSAQRSGGCNNLLLIIYSTTAA